MLLPAHFFESQHRVASQDVRPTILFFETDADSKWTGCNNDVVLCDLERRAGTVEPDAHFRLRIAHPEEAFLREICGTKNKTPQSLPSSGEFSGGYDSVHLNHEVTKISSLHKVVNS